MPSHRIPKGKIPLSMRPTLADQWSAYAAEVLPAGASDVQKIETKRGWYAGAAAMFGLLTGGLDEDSEPTEMDVEYMESIYQELNFFARQVKDGRS
jgi:hypothetical protein